MVFTIEPSAHELLGIITLTSQTDNIYCLNVDCTQITHVQNPAHHAVTTSKSDYQ